jgi:hypothetical protein
MLTGAGQKKSTFKAPITGLAVVKPLFVNPTNEDYKRLTGKDLPYTLEYVVKENSNINNREEFPIRILVHQLEKDVFEFVNFNVSNIKDVAQTGSKRFMDSKGNMTWSQSLETIQSNPNMSWFDSSNTRELYVGEYELYNWIQKLVSYDTRAEGANFKDEMTNAGITSDALFKGNTSGLQKLIDWSNKQGYALGMLFFVDEKVKDGNTIHNQKLASYPVELFFYTDEKDGVRTISNYSYKAMEKLIKGDESKGQKPVTIKGLYTYKLQDFDKETSLGGAPTTTIANSVSNGTTASSKWV